MGNLCIQCTFNLQAFIFCTLFHYYFVNYNNIFVFPVTIPVHTTNTVKTLDKAKTNNYYCCTLVEDLKEVQPLQIGQMENMSKLESTKR
ncbi:unnamed protein product [Rotaria magnacalcarata]|uniref:Uncharacterized protein n=2 Tax=Rotaria magnacalcarata TaxID=392030 RepID=A0A814NHU5_9BILA|nr:unnamed protein product [Rotaria magnacalcarata]